MPWTYPCDHCIRAQGGGGAWQRSGLEWRQDVFGKSRIWLFVCRDILTIKSMLEWLLGPRVHCVCVHGLILQHHEGSAVHTRKPVLPFLSWFV